jgi:hypothetical protein
LAKEEERRNARAAKRQEKTAYFAKTHALNALLVTRDLDEHTGFDANQLIKGIQSRIASHPEMILRGRGLGNFRVD